MGQVCYGPRCPVTQKTIVSEEYTMFNVRNRNFKCFMILKAIHYVCVCGFIWFLIDLTLIHLQFS